MQDCMLTFVALQNSAHSKQEHKKWWPLSSRDHSTLSILYVNSYRCCFRADI